MAERAGRESFYSRRHPSGGIGGEKVRLLFVGQAEYFRGCGLSSSRWAETKFVHFQYDADQSYIPEQIRAFGADVVICFRPEAIAKALFRELRAITIGFTSEPVPRSAADQHPDLLRRLSYLEKMDVSNFDRLVHFDVKSLDLLRRKGYPYWRGLPLPLDWEAYESNTALGERAGAIFIGRTTAYRDRFLDLCKRDFNVLHVAHGLEGNELRSLLSHRLIAINLHNEDYLSFENRILFHFAAGNLLLSQQLSPGYGLEVEEDHLRFDTPDQLYHLIGKVQNDPALFEGIRTFGALKAKQLFNSEDSYRALIDDLYLDLSLNGRRSPW